MIQESVRKDGNCKGFHSLRPCRYVHLVGGHGNAGIEALV